MRGPSHSDLLNAIHLAQIQFIEDAEPREVFDNLLRHLLTLTRSEYGFIGEVLRDAGGAPFLKTHAITDIAWSDETRAFYEQHAPEGLEFQNLKNLFGAAIVTGKPVIANEPAKDARSGGLPEGYPALRAFLGIPLHHRDELVGMVGVANRSEGYDESMIQFLSPFTSTCASIIRAYRSARKRRRAEEEQARLVKSLEAAQEAEQALRAEVASGVRRLTSILDALPVGCVATDRHARFTYWNAAATRLFGFAPDEARGRSAYSFLIPESASAHVAEIYERVEAGETPLASENENITKDGVTILCRWVNTAMRGPSGEFEGIVSICEDITERRKLEEQLRQAQKMESVGQLAGGLAHDFNNLLTIILGSVDLAQLRLSSEHPMNESLADIRQAGERARDLTRQLLAFSRRQILRVRPLDLSSVARDFLPLMRRTIPESIAIEAHLAEGLPQVSADPGQIEQVLMNLVVNARDAMPEGGKLTIETASSEVEGRRGRARDQEARGAEPRVLLRVTDTGMGMDEATRARVFEPFFTTKGLGTGLGLATVYGIVQQHGGSIRVDSEPGRGTTFTIELPHARAPRA